MVFIRCTLISIQTGAAMVQPNPAYIEEISTIFRTSPFPAHLGMRLTSLDLDRATVQLELKDFHLQLFGIAHGGVLATLVDTATYWAVYLRLPGGAGLVNVDLKLNYLKAASHGMLRAEGYAIRNGRTLCYSEASVFDSENDRIAHGTSTLMVLPDKGLTLKQAKHLNNQE
jgi:uncharacterized protein (TIGR00369 family)